MYPDHRYSIGQGLQTRSLSMQPPDYSLSFPARAHHAEPENTSSFHFPSFHKFSPIPLLDGSATSIGVLDSLLKSSSSQDLIQLTPNESQSSSGQYNTTLDLGQVSSSEPTVTQLDETAKYDPDTTCPSATDVLGLAHASSNAFPYELSYSAEADLVDGHDCLVSESSRSTKPQLKRRIITPEQPRKAKRQSTAKGAAKTKRDSACINTYIYRYIT